MFGSRLNDEVAVNIASYHISGISSVDLSYSNSANTIKPLGSSRGLTAAGGALSLIHISEPTRPY